MYTLKLYTQFLVFTSICLLSFSTSMAGQNCGALVCNNSVQISLGVECEVVLEPDMVLEAPNGTYEYEISIYDTDGEFIGNAVTGDQVNTTLQYKVKSSCDGNTCWGNIDLEANVLPVLESPCQFIAGNEINTTVELSSSNPSETVSLIASDDCQKVINLMGISNLKYNSGTPGNPVWSLSDIQVEVFNSAGSLIYSEVYLPGAFSDIVLLSTIGAYTIEVSSIVNQSVGDVTIHASVPNCNVGCVSWCGGSYPEIFLTPEQAVEIIDNSCGASLVSDIKIQQESVGDMCDDIGVLHVITYSANITMHGKTQKAILLTQAYREEKIDLSPGGIVSIHFPDPTTIDCSTDGIDPTLEEGSPEYLHAVTGDVKQAYPTYIDSHTLIPDTNIIDRIIHIEDIVGYRDTMISQPIDLDGDGVNEDVWVIVTIVDKELRDSIAFDTIVGPGFTNPHIPIKPGQIFCNILTSYSDIEFSACAGGKKIIRSWSMIDWCNSAIQLNGTQQIEITDQTAPLVESLDDVIVSIDPWQCSATYKFPDVVYTDDCSSNVEVEWRTSDGNVADGYVYNLWQNQGPIQVRALVTDECSNTTEETFSIVVVDNIPPVMVCQGSMQTTLTYSDSNSNSGIAQIYAESFNAGSHDSGCGDVTFKVARMNGCCGEECSEGETICLRRDKFGDCIEEGIKPVEDEYGDFVKFCCQDAGQIVQVILVGTDKQGNQNQCMIDVFVSDKSAPSLVCETVEISCSDNPDDVPLPQVLGVACDREYGFELASVTDETGNCGNQKIIKEWFIDADGSGDLTPGDSYCEQIITISDSETFDPYTIKWPKHLNGQTEQGFNIECDDDEAKIFLNHPVYMGDALDCVPDFDVDELKPVWCGSDCGLVGYSLDQETISSSDACLTIINRWSVVDWCTYNPNNDSSDGDESNNTDILTAMEDWAQGVCTTCPESAIYHDPVYFSYTQVRIDGFYTFNQIVKIIDETQPEILVDATVEINTIGGSVSKDDDTPCVGTGYVTAEAKDYCGSDQTSSDDLAWTISFYTDGQLVNRLYESGPSVTVETSPGSLGEDHNIVWSVKDGCGNESTANTQLSFVDDKAPTPLCIAGLTTAFMATDGSVSIWAKDFDLGSFDNCTSTDELVYTVVREGEQPIGFGDAGFLDQALMTFSCSNMESFIELNLYVWDANGNADYCTVGLLISDSGEHCPENEGQDCIDESLIDLEAECNSIDDPVCGCNLVSYSNVCEALKHGVLSYTAGPCETGSSIAVGGSVYTVDGQIIDNTLVTINAALPEYPQAMTNGTNGDYMFDNNPIGFNYNIRAAKDDKYINGISTLDLVLIQKHILGLAYLNSPFKVIAADVNNSQSVAASDLVMLQQLILGYIPNDVIVSDSWKFVAADQGFADVLHPWPYIEEANLVNVNSPMMSADFVGIKLGDVSGDVVANTRDAESESRSTTDYVFRTDEQVVRRGDEVSVDLLGTQAKDVFGMQFSLSHKGLVLRSIQSDHIEFGEDNYNVHSDMTHVSWANAYGDEVGEGDELLTLVFQAAEDLQLSEVLKLAKEGVKAELYVGDDLAVANLSIRIEDEGSDFALLGSYPNPMTTMSKIRFQSPRTGEFTLSIFDAAGRIVTAENKKMTKGLNEVLLERSTVAERGIYYFQIKADEFEETSSIIVID